jgi:hypothetical protein
MTKKMLSTLDFGGGPRKITGLPAPSSGSDAVIKTYADQVRLSAQSGSSYTLVIGDVDKVIGLSHTSTTLLVIPANASVAFPVGTVVWVRQVGVGQVQLFAPGVTVVGGAATPSQYSLMRLEKIATDTWTSAIVPADVQTITAGAGLGMTGGQIFLDDLSNFLGATDVIARSGTKTVQNIATETSLWNGTLFSVPGGALRQFDEIWIVQSGTYRNDASGASRDIELPLFLGGTEVMRPGTTGSLIPVVAFSRQWVMEWRLVFTAVGASGTVRVTERGSLGPAGLLTSASLPAIPLERGNATDQSIDTSVAMSIDPRVKLINGTSATQQLVCSETKIMRVNAP